MRDQRRRRKHGSDRAVETPPPAPAPEIPVLKEKEEEKKGAGIPWYAGSGAGGPGLIGGQGMARVGGSLAARGGFLSRLAAGLSNALGGPGTFLGGLFAGALGRWLVLGGLLGWGGLMLAAGAKLFGWGAAGVAAPGGVPLSGLGPSGIVIDAPKDRSLGYLSRANQGEILWEQNKPVQAPEPAKDAAAPAEAPSEEPKKEEPPPFEMPDVSALMGGGLNRDGFVKKLTGDVSQLHGGGGPRLKDAGGFQLKKSFGQQAKLQPAQRGRLGGMSRAKRALSSSRLSNMRGRASRAAGQLKLAKNMSVAGQNAASVGDARTFSADAFDQGKTIGGGLSGVEGDGIVVPPGSGAPGVEPGVPDLPPGENITPYQSQMDTAKGLGNQAAALKKMGMMMLAIGAALVATGLALMGNHTTFPIGWALLGAGLALIAMGMMMLGMSANMAEQAKGQGQNVEDQYGQKDQGAIVDDCAQQATSQGTKTENCQSTPPEQVTSPSNDVHQAVEDEMNADYTLEGAQ